MGKASLRLREIIPIDSPLPHSDHVSLLARAMNILSKPFLPLLLATALSVPLGTAHARAQSAPVPTESAPVCVTPWQEAEKRIQKGVPAAHVAVPDYSGIADAPVAAGLTGAIRRVDLPPGKKLVALTFDLCETSNEVAGYDGEVFNALRADHIPATLFSGGHWAVTHGSRFGELAADPLFEIGNHTWTHANLRLADAEKLKREVRAPLAAFSNATAASICRRPEAPDPSHTRLFRFPFGACNPTAMKAVNDAGMLAIQWDVSADDASPFRSADAIVKDTLAAVRPGSIILAHGNGRGYHTGAALPRIIRELKARGYEFVTVGQLLAAGTPVIVSSCYDSHPGDTDKYDTWGQKKPTLPAPHAATTTPTSATPASSPQPKTTGLSPLKVQP